MSINIFTLRCPFLKLLETAKNKTNLIKHQWSHWSNNYCISNPSWSDGRIEYEGLNLTLWIKLSILYHPQIGTRSSYYPKLWWIVGSNDYKRWGDIDYRVNNSELNGKLKQFVFVLIKISVFDPKKIVFQINMVLYLKVLIWGKYILNIANSCHNEESLFKKLYKVIHHYKAQIKQTFSNSDIFNIFGNNIKILFFFSKMKSLRLMMIFMRSLV